MKLTVPALLLAALLSGPAVSEEAPPAPPEGQITLLDGNLDGWEAHDSGGSGQVYVEDGVVILGPGEMLTGIVYKDYEKLKPMNYEISLEMMRKSGSDFPCALTFPMGDWKTCASFIAGGWGGGVIGISSLNGLDASENQTMTINRVEDHVWHKVRLRITPNRIQAWLNDKKVVDQDTTDMRISVRYGNMDQYLPISLTSYQCKGAVRKVTWRPVEGPDETEEKPAAE